MTQHASTLKALTERLQELQARVSHIDAEMHQLLPADFEEQAADLESQIKHAIDRIHNGQYGMCSQCGEPIAVSRLKAQPTATRCIACAA